MSVSLSVCSKLLQMLVCSKSFLAEISPYRVSGVLSFFLSNFRQSFFQNVRISPYGVSGALSFFLSNFPAIFLLKAGDGGTMSLPVQIPLWIEACSESVLTKIKAPMSGRQKSAALFSLKRSSCHSSKISPL